jgi:hypothetical protein
MTRREIVERWCAWQMEETDEMPHLQLEDMVTELRALWEVLDEAEKMHAKGQSTVGLAIALNEYFGGQTNE